MKKKLLIITQYFWPEEFRLNDLAKELSERGFEIDVITGIPNYPVGKYFKNYNILKKRKEIWNGIKVFRIFQTPRGKNSKLKLALNYFTFLIFGLITVLFNKKKYDKILVYQLSPPFVGFLALLKKKFSKTPIFFYVHDLWPESIVDTEKIKFKSLINLLDKMMNLFYKNSSMIITQSPSIKKHIVLKYKISSEKIIYIPNTIESIFLNKGFSTNFKSFNSKKFNIVFTGNIGKAQDFDTIIKSVEILKNKKINNINFIIVGDGRDKSRIEKLIIEKKINQFFKFTGRLPLDQMPKILSKADALLISLKKSEVFSKTIPAKLQSYMSAGKPILTICDGITSEIVNESKSGLTAKSGDYVKFISNLETITKLSFDELSLMGENSSIYFKNNFSRESIYSKIISLLND